MRILWKNTNIKTFWETDPKRNKNKNKNKNTHSCINFKAMSNEFSEQDSTHETTSSYTPLPSDYPFWEHGRHTQVHEQAVIEPEGSKGHFLLLQTCWPGLTEHRATTEVQTRACSSVFFSAYQAGTSHSGTACMAWISLSSLQIRAAQARLPLFRIRCERRMENGERERWRYRKWEWKGTQSITEHGASGRLRLTADVYDSGWKEISEYSVFEDFREIWFLWLLCILSYYCCCHGLITLKQLCDFIKGNKWLLRIPIITLRRAHDWPSVKYIWF